VTRRGALVVGAGSPGAGIASGLAELGWAVSHLDDDSAPVTDRTVAEQACSDLSLVVHARYPEACRRRRRLVELSAADWKAACDEPLEAAVRMARGAHGPLAAAAPSGGCIVFVVPVTASAGGSGFAPLAAAAEGCRILAKSLARSWGRDGIRSHSLMLDASAFLGADAPAGDSGLAGGSEASALHDSPLGRLPDVESEVAGVIDALAGARMDVVVGSSLVVDGGLWMPG